MTDATLITGYREAGYVLLRSFFQKEEVDLLRNIAKEDKELDQHSFGRKDGEGEPYVYRSGITREKAFTVRLRDVTRWQRWQKCFSPMNPITTTPK